MIYTEGAEDGPVGDSQLDRKKSTVLVKVKGGSFSRG
jgi:hypothetical protein